jgi:hypothetical protein
MTFTLGYAWERERQQEWFDDIAQYEVLRRNGDDGWEWRSDRFADTSDRGGAHGAGPRRPWPCAAVGHSTGPRPRDRRMAVQRGGEVLLRPPLLFGTSYVVSGDPKIDNQTRDRWFDTSKFSVRIASRRGATPGTSTA